MPLPHDEAGTGAAVVLLHAGVADRTMWSEHLAPLAAAGYRAIALDLPGFGEASTTAVPWEAVLKTMDALNLNSATLVGNSWGGGVALRVAALAPHRVDRLVLVSAGPFDADPSPQLASAWAAEEEALEHKGLEAAVSAVLAAWTLPDAPRELRERLAAMQRRAYLVQEQVPPEPEPPDPLEDLSAIGIPTLVVVGGHDLPDFHDAAGELSRRLRQARRAEIPAAGHLAPLETPEAFRELLLEFLAG